MTIQEVIKAGKDIQTPDFPWYSEFTLNNVLILLAIVALAIAFIIWGIAKDGKFRIGIGKTLLIFSAAIIVFEILASLSAQLDYREKAIDKWKMEVAKPYIESLPVAKNEIIFIKIDPELSTNVHGSTFFGNGYTYSTTIERTPLVVSYKDNGIVTKTDWFETRMELTSEQKPFINYQVLKQDLGHGIKAGTYNTHVFLPQSYSFTDIK